MLQIIAVAGARPVILEIFVFALALFSVVAVFYLNAFASARPVIMEIISFAFALFFTSLRISTGGRPMAAPTGEGFKMEMSIIKI